jgi:protoheme IX farnesyltransferase
VGAFPGAIPFMLGWVAATNNFGIEAGTLFLIQFFGSFHIFGQSDGFCMKIMKKLVFYVANRKRDNQLLCKLFCILLAFDSFFVAMFRFYRELFIPVSAVLVFLLGIWMLFTL